MGQPVRAVFEATAGPGEQPIAGSHLFGLLSTAFDGTVVDLAAYDAIAEQFAVPAGGSLPQARLVTLVTCGTHRVIAAATESIAVSEQALVDQLGTALRPGMLNLADRNGARSLPAKTTATLPDRSQLVRLRELSPVDRTVGGCGA